LSQEVSLFKGVYKKMDSLDLPLPSSLEARCRFLPALGGIDLSVSKSRWRAELSCGFTDLSSLPQVASFPCQPREEARYVQQSAPAQLSGRFRDGI